MPRMWKEVMGVPMVPGQIQVVKMNHIQPCGCIVVTKAAHLLEIRLCRDCKKEWLVQMGDYVDSIDQDIEDEIFGAE